MRATSKRSATGHTPGPWQAEGGWITADKKYGVGGEVCVVAQIHSGVDCAPDEHTDANAWLITEAPNLLAAAEDTLALWKKHGLGDHDAESEPVYLALQSAIAKAKGHGRRR